MTYLFLLICALTFGYEGLGLPGLIITIITIVMTFLITKYSKTLNMWIDKLFEE